MNGVSERRQAGSMMSLLFVHSPLLGPSSCRPIAGEAMQRGIPTAVPDLTRAATAEPPASPRFAAAAAEATHELPPPIAVIGHSGAGAFLPEIGRALEQRLGALIFVDAVIPPLRGAFTLPIEVQRLFDAQTADTTLLPWLDWWPAEVLDHLLPAMGDRAALRADLPNVPRSFFDHYPSVPDGWARWACGYLQLSSAYAVEFEVAGDRTWPRTGIDGNHLSIYTDPKQVLAAALGIVKDLAP